MTLFSHLASDAVEVHVRGVARDDLGASEACNHSRSVFHPGWMQTRGRRRKCTKSTYGAEFVGRSAQCAWLREHMVGTDMKHPTS